MPELPEVESIVNRFRPLVDGKKIVRFESRWPKQVTPSVAEVEKSLKNKKIIDLQRRGKNIVIHLEGGLFLLVHLRMSGRFEWQTKGKEEARHARALWEFKDGDKLLFCDARKFGTIKLVDDLEAATAHMGIEPLGKSFTIKRFKDILHNRSRVIKSLLLDQNVIAGLGNIYTDESLFDAGIHPKRISNTLSDEEIKKLHAAIKKILKKAIKNNGTSFDWIYPGGKMQDYLNVYGRTGENCKRCKGKIEKTTVGQRGTHFCSQCQIEK